MYEFSLNVSERILYKYSISILLMTPNIYEGSIYRPPSEAYSLILQATIGCSWNRCTFCIAFKDKKYREKSLEEIKRDVDLVYPYYKDVNRIFLADGNAIAMSTDELEKIIKFLYLKFQKLERITIYGGPIDLNKKSVEELKRLKDAGLTMVYFGLESGSDEVLKLIKKGANSKTMIETAKKVKDAGLKLSIIFILGLGGTELSKTHANETARVLNAIDPDYAAALTLMVVRGSDIENDIKSGKITLLNPIEVLYELREIVEKLELTSTIFRANHASNYAEIRGTLSKDKKEILSQIEDALVIGDYKPEFLRGL